MIMNTTLKQLTEKGEAMRKAQKAYFASYKMDQYDRDKLRDKAKELEKEFDRTIKIAQEELSTQIKML